MKPVELMTLEEKKAYYLTRRKAQLAGDSGVLPDGRTCAEAREEYVEQCNNDPYKTLTHVEGEQAEAAKADASGLLEDDEFPKGVVAPELPASEVPDVPNKRCC